MAKLTQQHKVKTRDGTTFAEDATGKPTHIWNVAKATWQEIKHPRDAHGKFAKKPGSGAPGGHALHKPAGKTAPKGFSLASPSFKPKQFHDMPVWAKSVGLDLYSAKQHGKFANDYEYWLYAQKLAAAHNKKHPDHKITANHVKNAAMRHEIEDKGKFEFLGLAGDATKAPSSSTAGLPMPKHTPVGEQPDLVYAAKQAKHTHAKTPGGVKLNSKFLPPGVIQPTGKTMQGVSGAQVYEDKDGKQYLVKVPGGSKGTSKAYSNNKFLIDLDLGTSKIQNKSGLPTPAIHKVTLANGQEASVHKMFSRAEDAFPDNSVDISKMDQADLFELQKNMVVDWLLSNHDAHTGNFLKTDKGIIGIDKGQSFKYFGKDKLSPKFGSDLNPPLAPNKPVYSNVMSQYIDGKSDKWIPFNNTEMLQFIGRIEGIDDGEYKKLLRPYAEQAAEQGLLSYPGKSSADNKQSQVEFFLDSAVKRKNKLAQDFGDLQIDLDQLKDAKAQAQHGGPSTTSFPKKKLPPKAGPRPSQEWLYKLDGYQAGSKYNKGLLSFEDLKDYVAHSQNVDLDDIVGWFGSNFIDKPKLRELKDAFNNGGVPKPAKLSPGDAMDFQDAQVGQTLNFETGSPGVSFGTMKVVGIGPNPVDQEQSVHMEAVGDGISPAGSMMYAPRKSFLTGKITFVSEGTGPTAAPAPAISKVAAGHKVVQHPTEISKFAIQKPGGEFSKNPAGEVKSWDTPTKAAESSTMAKYFKQAEQQKYAAMSAAQGTAAGTSDLDPDNPPFGMSKAEVEEHNELKQTILAGNHTPDDFLKFKQLKNKSADAKKAAGAAAVIEDDDDTSGYVAPNTAQTGSSKGKIKQPVAITKGKAPPTLAELKTKGPNVLDDGKKLWEMKKSGQFTDYHEQWKAAQKLSGQFKKQAEKDNPGKKLQSGVDYASPNQIRWAALRYEFDENGNVAWESVAEKTSVTVGTSAAQAKATNLLHQHVPKTNRTNSTHAMSAFDGTPVITDKNAPAGSYANPHAFSDGYEMSALQAYGRKYTDTTGWVSTQQSAVKYYSTSSGASALNSYLRTGDLPAYSGTSTAALDERIQELDKAFDAPQVKPLDDWTVVARGTNGGWELGLGTGDPTFEQLKGQIGKKVQNKSYISSSLATSGHFGGTVQINYKLPPGFRGIFMGNSSAMTHHPGEKEWLLPRNLQYKILDVKQKGSKNIVTVEVTGQGKL